MVLRSVCVYVLFVCTIHYKCIHMSSSLLSPTLFDEINVGHSVTCKRLGRVPGVTCARNRYFADVHTRRFAVCCLCALLLNTHSGNINERQASGGTERQLPHERVNFVRVS